MKTRVILIAMAWTVSALLTGCGGGGGGSGSAAPAASAYTVKPLSLGNPTKVEPGYEVVNASDDAEIDIVVQGNQKTMTLISGSASVKIPNR